MLEFVQFQMRMLPPHTKHWSNWYPCSEEVARSYMMTPEILGWKYEVRETYTGNISAIQKNALEIFHALVELESAISDCEFEDRCDEYLFERLSYVLADARHIIDVIRECD